MGQICSYFIIFSFIIFTRSSQSYADFSYSAGFSFPGVKNSSVWTNNNTTLQPSIQFNDGSQARIILIGDYPDNSEFAFACGFYCNGVCRSFVFALFYFCNYNFEFYPPFFFSPCSPNVIWSANRDTPVKENSTVELASDGGLILRDVDGSVVWSTGTSRKSVVGMKITGSGNLVLFDSENRTVWQSFEHPTDTLMLGQTLKEGQNLTSNSSLASLTQGQFYFTLVKDAWTAEILAYTRTNPPQLYSSDYQINNVGNQSLYMVFNNGSLDINGKQWMAVKSGSRFQYMRLDFDGHLRIYDFGTLVADILTLGVCDYPTACGNYSICSNGQCTCPYSAHADSSLFAPLDDRQTNLGCYPVNAISCGSMQNHQMITLDNVSYFGYKDFKLANFYDIDANSCKEACLKNCSCKAAMFKYTVEDSHGSCYLLSELFTMNSIQPTVSTFNSSAFIKVQITVPAGKKLKNRIVILVSSIGGSLALILAIGITILTVRREKVAEEETELDQVPGMPTRFTLEELKISTSNFSSKLGGGGFGSVFEGKIGNEMIAVKRLEGVGQGKREFLAEVSTIGKLHHVNLVTLVGFCAEKSNRLLVYEFMSNGSLDKWIFYKDHTLVPLSWQTRCKIISDIAKGLSYLHEECKQRIAHLDIKPENILLDKNFNAKISDFGLAKLIDRDQKQVMTKMRGTPGYLAPEWLTSIITEKVDIYSFGIVIMEIVCGRKNLDYAQPEDKHLITLLQNKFQANQLLDIVDSHGIDIVLHKEEVMKMIKLAVQCLQIESNKRPPMSTVVKILEGEISMNSELDYDSVANIIVNLSDEKQQSYTPAQTVSILSGPR